MRRSVVMQHVNKIGARSNRLNQILNYENRLNTALGRIPSELTVASRNDMAGVRAERVTALGSQPGIHVLSVQPFTLRPAQGERGTQSRISPTASYFQNAATAQHPATHFPAGSNSIVLPLNGTCTGTLTAFMKVSVLVPGSTLPPLVATSFACDGITDAGLTNWLIT
jgi:hypothetical protein